MAAVELLYWDGCPSHDQALAELRAALAELGLEDVEVTLTEVSSDEQAVARGFVGSPTLRVGGVDVVEPDQAAPVLLSCRVYRLRDGRYSPTPDPLDLRDALRALAATER
ncbi:MAG: DF family (seleno)protein [Solirubrobacteraceae bacterium]